MPVDRYTTLYGRGWVRRSKNRNNQKICTIRYDYNVNGFPRTKAGIRIIGNWLSLYQYCGDLLINQYHQAKKKKPHHPLDQKLNTFFVRP